MNDAKRLHHATSRLASFAQGGEVIEGRHLPGGNSISCLSMASFAREVDDGPFQGDRRVVTLNPPVFYLPFAPMKGKQRGSLAKAKGQHEAVCDVLR